MTGERPPRVAFVAGNIYPLLAGRADIPLVGGAEVQQRAIAGGLRARGFEVTYLTEDFGQGPEVVIEGARVLSYTFGRNKLRMAATLWRALNRASADVYYVRGAPKFLVLLLLHGTVTGIPLVLGMSTNQMTHRYPATGLNRAEQLIYASALARAAAVVAQTRSQAELLARNYRVPIPVIIPGGTDLPPPAVDGTPERRRTVVWLASLLPYKGVETVFDLAELCPGLRFEIIGGPGRGAEAYHDEMRQAALARANVTWRGPLARSEIDGALAGSLALINTTRPWRGVPDLEGFPNVYLEAWRNGVPTLTLHNDPDDVITRHGLGTRCDTPAAMARELNALASDPLRRAALGERVRAHVAREHDMARVADAYADLFRRVARRRTRDRA